MTLMDGLVVASIIILIWLARKSRRVLKAFLTTSAIVAAILLGFMLWTLEHQGVAGMRPYGHLMLRLGFILTLLSVLSLNFMARAPVSLSETRRF